jgi:hypothetical protein
MLSAATLVLNVLLRSKRCDPDTEEAFWDGTDSIFEADSSCGGLELGSVGDFDLLSVISFLRMECSTHFRPAVRLIACGAFHIHPHCRSAPPLLFQLSDHIVGA